MAKMTPKSSEAIRAITGSGEAIARHTKMLAKARKAEIKFNNGEITRATRDAFRDAAAHSRRSMGPLAREGAAALKRLGSGVLSPAGVAEGVALDVAARTAKPAREKMQERGVQKVEKAAPKTAAAMRKARVTKA